MTLAGSRPVMKIDRIHHVAYRCRDAKETVLWYQKMLNMDFVLAIAGKKKVTK